MTSPTIQPPKPAFNHLFVSQKRDERDHATASNESGWDLEEKPMGRARCCFSVFFQRF